LTALEIVIVALLDQVNSPKPEVVTAEIASLSVGQSTLKTVLRQFLAQKILLPKSLLREVVELEETLINKGKSSCSLSK
jgi:hypothetical protein